MANRIAMGIGKLGFKNLVFKRKYRWTFEVRNICGNQTVPSSYVKIAARPHLSFEETEIHYLNAKKIMPGKRTWETIAVTYYDVATADNGPLFSWLASVYSFNRPDLAYMGSNSGDYSGTGDLVMYDGCGQPLEQWILEEIWPQDIDFGELDYSSSDEATIAVTMRFQEAQYVPICPTFPIVNCCTPCVGIGGIGGGGGGGIQTARTARGVAL